MIPAAMFDHRATVWSPDEKTGGTFREVERRWKRGQQRVGLKLDTTSERRDDTGGGERTLGVWKGICALRVSVAEGDVLEVYSGPMAPLNLKVDGVHRPGRSHTQLVLAPFSGKLDI